MKMDTRTELMGYATEYTIGKYKLNWRGTGWGIYNHLHNGYSNKHKTFVYEPCPSSRTPSSLPLEPLTGRLLRSVRIQA